MLVNGELLWRPGEDTPRVTIRGVRPLAALAKAGRCRLTVELTGPAIDELEGLVSARRGGRGEIVALVPLGGGGRANLSLGIDFAIDNEVVAKVERLRGVGAATLMAVG